MASNDAPASIDGNGGGIRFIGFISIRIQSLDGDSIH